MFSSCTIKPLVATVLFLFYICFSCWASWYFVFFFMMNVFGKLPHPQIYSTENFTQLNLGSMLWCWFNLKFEFQFEYLEWINGKTVIFKKMERNGSTHLLYYTHTDLQQFHFYQTWMFINKANASHTDCIASTFDMSTSADWRIYYNIYGKITETHKNKRRKKKQQK